jgi:hypothetical protein
LPLNVDVADGAVREEVGSALEKPPTSGFRAAAFRCGRAAQRGGAALFLEKRGLVRARHRGQESRRLDGGAVPIPKDDLDGRLVYGDGVGGRVDALEAGKYDCRPGFGGDQSDDAHESVLENEEKRCGPEELADLSTSHGHLQSVGEDPVIPYDAERRSVVTEREEERRARSHDGCGGRRGPTVADRRQRLAVIPSKPADASSRLADTWEVL